MTGFPDFLNASRACLKSLSCVNPAETFPANKIPQMFRSWAANRMDSTALNKSTSGVLSLLMSDSSDGALYCGVSLITSPLPITKRLLSLSVKAGLSGRLLARLMRAINSVSSKKVVITPAKKVPIAEARTDLRKSFMVKCLEDNSTMLV